MARDLEPYPPQPLSRRRQSVNMHKYESFVPESRYALASAFETSHPSSNSTSPQISRANSDVSLYAPIRRRSWIQTPGVATRAPSVSEPTRRSSTKRNPRTRHSRTTSFDPGVETISVLPRISDCCEERAVTPNDIDYKQLGTMRFGSLRITNGAPSPCCDGKGGTDDTEQKPFQPKNGSDLSVDAEPEGRTTGLKIFQPRPVSVSVSPVTATFLELESGDLCQPNVAPKHEKNPRARHSCFNLGSFSRIGSESRPTKLQTTSQHISAEDTLLGEGLSLSPSEYESVAPRGMASTWCRASRRGSDAASKTRSIARPDSGFISSPISEASSEPLSKTDSGYSSNFSLRSPQNSKVYMDKEPPPRPDEPFIPPIPNRSSSASLVGDARLPSSGPVFLEKESAPALLEQEACAPPPPPKDVDPVVPATPSAIRKSASTPLLNRTATSAKTKGAARRLSLFSMSGNRVSEPESSNSTQDPVAVHQADIQKPGPLKRLLSVASRMELRGSLGRSFRIKSPKETGRRAGAGVSGLETANAEEPSGTEPPQAPPSHLKSPEGPPVRRHRSLQSIPAAIVNAAVSVLPSRKPLREPVSFPDEESDSDEDEDGETEGNELRSKTNSTESDAVSTDDFTRDTLMRNGFDPSFMAMTSARDAYFSPAPSIAPSRPSSRARCRTGRVASCSVDVGTVDVQAMSRTGSLASLRPRSSQTSIREHPHMSASNSLKPARSVMQLRVPAQLRPQSTPSRLHCSQSQAHCSRSSLELIYSYPPITASNRSSLDSTGPRLGVQHEYQQRSNSVREGEDPISFNDSEKSNFLPKGPGSSHSRTDSLSSQASSTGLYAQSIGVTPYSGPQKHIPQRPSSASQFLDMKRQGPALRHHASYEMQPFRLVSRPSREFRRQSPNLWTSTHYDQLQMQYGGTAFDPKAGGNPPYVPRASHSRSRSSEPQGPGAPYRVLHSYSSPAYRHVPIWG